MFQAISDYTRRALSMVGVVTDYVPDLIYTEPLWSPLHVSIAAQRLHAFRRTEAIARLTFTKGRRACLWCE